MAGKEVKKKDEGAVPTFMQGHAGMGTENIGSQDIEIPRIKLLQALSPELDEIKDSKAGQFIHSISEDILHTPLRMIPVFSDIRFILWRPRWDGGGILARADDGVNWNVRDEFEVRPSKDSKRTVIWSTLAGTVEGSKLGEWGSSDPEESGSPPAANKMYNIVAYLPDHPHLSPVVVTLQRSQIRVARKLMGKLKIAQVPSFGLRFELDSFKDSNPNGEEFYNYKFTGDGFVTDEALYSHCMGLYQRFAAEGVKIRDEEGLQEEGQTQTEDANAARKKAGSGDGAPAF